MRLPDPKPSRRPRGWRSADATAAAPARGRASRARAPRAGGPARGSGQARGRCPEASSVGPRDPVVRLDDQTLRGRADPWSARFTMCRRLCSSSWSSGTFRSAGRGAPRRALSGRRRFRSAGRAKSVVRARPSTSSTRLVCIPHSAKTSSRVGCQAQLRSRAAAWSSRPSAAAPAREPESGSCARCSRSNAGSPGGSTRSRRWRTCGPPPVELLDGAVEADRAFLDQVEERHA